MAVLAGCGSSDQDRFEGQTTFTSAPPNGTSGGLSASPGAGGDNAGAPPPSAPPATPSRKVEETDLYRLDGNRLYYLNSYRGLMVFDVTNPDRPALLGRSAIFGTPVDMIVRNGIATVVVGDWYGQLDDGSPFHGSIVRGLDATDPAHIKVLGDAKLGGWVRDDRVVGDVIYAVSEDYGWSYGWGYADAGGVSAGGVSVGGVPRETVIVSSVSFANRAVKAVDQRTYDGFSGVFNVTPNAIMLASTAGSTFEVGAPGQTSLLYLDISDPGGKIVERGKLAVKGQVNGWGADNGRWNLDFADGKTAHVIGQSPDYLGGYTLSTVDFSNPDLPVLDSALPIASAGWNAAARFDTNRLYLSPENDYFSNDDTTPFEVFDLSNAKAPRLAGTVNVPGQVWNLLLAPDSKIFALGNDYQVEAQGDPVSLHYIDVSNPAAPAVLGTSTFGQGWAWTPAAGSFKAFTMNASAGLVVLPFSGWDFSGGYNNGLQLIQFTPSSLTTAGTAKTKGYVERGIFVGNRLISLSDVSLAVIDYSVPSLPRVMTELTLARNVVAAQPVGASVAEVSSDWFYNDVSTSEVRVLPAGAAEETADVSAVPTVKVDGVGASVFTNGRFSYVVTSVASGRSAGCEAQGCGQWTQQVQVVDVGGGQAALRGKVALPAGAGAWWYGWGWDGFWWYDWWSGAGVVQVGNDVLAFRRYEPVYDGNGNYVDSKSRLYVVDLSNPDAPRIASTVVQLHNDDWWGNMKVVGSTLWLTHYEWIDRPNGEGGFDGFVRYFLDSVDLSDRAHPRIGARINVPGLLVGGDPNDPSLLYTVDYRWGNGDRALNDFDVVRVNGRTATLISHTPISGYVGSTFFSGDQAYVSAQQYFDNGTGRVDLHAIDLRDPSHPRDRVATDRGWGWLLSVVGDRALITTGWGDQSGIDVYRLPVGGKPKYEQTIRSRGWGVNAVSRQGQTLYLTSGYWGVQAVQLQ
ncbi:MAG TPA: beta-propeller domain-containing protein [Kofleriaceae bacterium]|nr:beta-propeller domain-containing protein [Kofleriaceae bacterium]